MRRVNPRLHKGLKPEKKERIDRMLGLLKSEMTYTDLEQHFPELSPDTLRSYMWGLVEEGAVERVGGTCHKPVFRRAEC